MGQEVSVLGSHKSQPHHGCMDSIRVGIKVVPNASREGIIGWLGEDLKIRVSQPPEAGRANERVCELLAP